MKLLIVDTSTTVSSIALIAGEELLAEELMSAGKETAARLVPAIGALLAGAGLTPAELDGFGVTIGPGSFTGLRVGVATVKGLALATGKPVVGISSLALLAMNLPWAAHPVCPLFDARKQEVYAALYDCREEPRPLIADTVAPPAAFLSRICGPTLFVGDGARRYRSLIAEALGPHAIFPPSHLHRPRAAAGADLVRTALARGQGSSAASVNPVYIRASEAELARKSP